MGYYLNPTEDALQASPSVETRNMCSADQRLRERGFVLLSRSKTGPTMWTRGGKRFTQVEALDIAKREKGK